MSLLSQLDRQLAIAAFEHYADFLKSEIAFIEDSQLVDDPSSHPEKFPTEADQTKERKRLFSIIEELVSWDNIKNQKLLDAAKKEIINLIV